MSQGTVFVIDDDPAMHHWIGAVLRSHGYSVRTFFSAQEFLDGFLDVPGGCLLVDVQMPDMDGLQLLQVLADRGASNPVIMMTGFGEVAVAVRAMKAGAIDFIEKPIEDSLLLATIRQALASELPASDRSTREHESAAARTALLTRREREILAHIVAGKQNKMIAFDLRLSIRTVENHRANIMTKMKARSSSDLIRWALMAGIRPAPEGSRLQDNDADPEADRN